MLPDSPGTTRAMEATNPTGIRMIYTHHFGVTNKADASTLARTLATPNPIATKIETINAIKWFLCGFSPLTSSVIPGMLPIIKPANKHTIPNKKPFNALSIK